MLLITQIFEKETANFPVKKRFWPIFVVFSSVTNLTLQFVRVQKVLR